MHFFFPIFSLSLCFKHAFTKRVYRQKINIFSLRKKNANFLAQTKYIPHRKKDGNEMESQISWRCYFVIFLHASEEKSIAKIGLNGIWLACKLFTVTLQQQQHKQSNINKTHWAMKFTFHHLSRAPALALPIFSLSLSLPIFNNQSNVIIFISIRSLECNFLRCCVVAAFIVINVHTRSVRASELMRMKFDNRIR